ncbi:kelch 38 isoform X1 [Octopus vulgaris]|uniref:Kelch 38 isoform X1 n=1 Tax=Octopus vulgaris TaxID=6645 RepID=A0AA36FJ02_OCTVU|nr:kelch 38 isoform X1 [Octopus vulgaris]
MTTTPHQLEPTDSENQLTEGSEVLTYQDKISIERRDSLLYQFYKQNIFCDVTLVVGKTHIRTHSVILVSTSEYFRGMFTSSCQESNRKIIDYTDMFADADVLKSIIEYMYTGEISLKIDSIVEVLHASEYFLLTMLKWICSKFLALNLKPLNSLMTWKLSHLYNLEQLKVIVGALLEEVFCKEVVENTDMRHFPDFCIQELINHQSIFRWSKPEDIIFLITKWLGLDDNRRSSAKKLLLSYLEKQGFNSILYQVNRITRLKPFSQNKFFQQQQDVWTILISEKLLPEAISFFCEKSQNWIVKTHPNLSGVPLGIVDGNYLVLHISEQLGIELVNLTTQRKYIIRSTVFSDLLSESRTHSETCKIVFYCYSGKIYANFMKVCENPVRSLCLHIFNYNIISDNWSQIGSLRENLNTYCHFDNCSFYFREWHLIIPFGEHLFFGIGLQTSRTQHISESTPVEVDCDKEQIILIKCNLNKVSCHVWCTRVLKNFEYSGFSSAFILKNRIIFIEPASEQKLFNPSDFSRTMVTIECYSVELESKNWIRERFNIPIPETSFLPLDLFKFTHVKFPSFISKIVDQKIVLAVHKAPYIFQIYVFDLLSYNWTTLPPCNLPAVSQMKLSYARSYKPICQLVKDTSEKNLLLTNSIPFHSIPLGVKQVSEL